jgi:hypothetical protein
VIGPWIAETQAKKVAAQAEIRTATGRHRMSRDEIEAVVTTLGDLARIVRGADPADKAELYAKLRLALTYQPEEKQVEATIKLGLNMPKGFVSEARVATYVHDRHRADRRVHVSCWRCAMTEQMSLLRQCDATGTVPGAGKSSGSRSRRP